MCYFPSVNQNPVWREKEGKGLGHKLKCLEGFDS